jgi:hypothetical protein
MGVNARGGDVFFSADIEADGPIPGPYSMLALGLVVAGAFDGEQFTRAEPSAQSFYRELRPISDTFDENSLAVAGLDRQQLCKSGAAPAGAMSEAAEWVRSTAGNGRPVLVAYPLSYDWMWLYWYFVRFGGGSPFGHSRCLDIKTMYQQKAHVILGAATKRHMPRHLVSSRRHTHNALDDAIEQAELFANVWEWPGPTG